MVYVGVVFFRDEIAAVRFFSFPTERFLIFFFFSITLSRLAAAAYACTAYTASARQYHLQRCTRVLTYDLFPIDGRSAMITTAATENNRGRRLRCDTRHGQLMSSLPPAPRRCIAAALVAVARRRRDAAARFREQKERKKERRKNKVKYGEGIISSGPCYARRFTVTGLKSLLLYFPVRDTRPRNSAPRWR